MMGLDMYAKVRDGKFDKPADFEELEADEELYYWRKHPNLHGWMHNLYRLKGGTSEDFNLNTVEVTSADLDTLEKVVLGQSLPETSGFFFGQTTPDRIGEDIEFIRLARAAIEDGRSVYYTSWW
jgi:hypothetical protein